MNRIVSNIDRERAERSKEKGTGNGKRDYGGMFEYVDRRYGAAYREYDSPKKRSQ